MANIINYTTTIDVYKTIGEIQGILVDNGADKIMFDYEGKQPVAIRFFIKTNGRDVLVCLPARPKAVQKVLEKMKREKGSRMQVKPDFEQACRVAWRVVKDLVEAQMSMVLTEQAEFTEVFLPYLIADRSGRTFFEMVRDNNFLLPAGEP